jgi:hypothetical protein
MSYKFTAVNRTSKAKTSAVTMHRIYTTIVPDSSIEIMDKYELFSAWRLNKTVEQVRMSWIKMQDTHGHYI